MSRQVWMLDHLPSSQAYDVITICIVMTLAVLSVIYPARLASRIDPAEVSPGDSITSTSPTDKTLQTILEV